MKTKYSEVVKDLKSAEEFCKINLIEPSEIVILWYEEETPGGTE